MKDYRIEKYPASRISTIDICEIGRKKHHVTAMVELDVTTSREKIKLYRKQGKISFIAWMIRVIGHTIANHPEIASFSSGKRKVIIFSDVNVSTIVEKKIGENKVPMPLLITQADKRSVESITGQIEQAKNVILSQKDIVLQKNSGRLERLYYNLPGFARRSFWRLLLNHPRIAFPKMGNVAVTSIGMIGNVKGWFIPISVHPVCFGIGNIIKKPMVVNNQIEIREVLHMSVLIDHDVVDGAPMTRFLSELSVNIEKGLFLDCPPAN